MDISGLKEKIEGEISRIANADDVKQVKVSILGRKGIFAEYLDKLKTLDKDQRRDAGKAINDVKSWADQRLGELEKQFEEIERRKREAASRIDITMPGSRTAFWQKASHNVNTRRDNQDLLVSRFCRGRRARYRDGAL